MWGLASGSAPSRMLIVVERDADFGDDGALHGKDGPLPIRRVPRSVQTPFNKAVEAELARRDHAWREDQNGPWEDGLFPIAVNLDDRGERASTETAYLTDAVRRRPNLAVWTESHAERVAISCGRAVPSQRL
jgi:5-(hydroxymethyl)furfural/furfural oxidase